VSPGRYTLMAVNDAARWMAEISECCHDEPACGRRTERLPGEPSIKRRLVGDRIN